MSATSKEIKPAAEQQAATATPAKDQQKPQAATASATASNAKPNTASATTTITSTASTATDKRQTLLKQDARTLERQRRIISSLANEHPAEYFIAKGYSKALVEEIFANKKSHEQMARELKDVQAQLAALQAGQSGKLQTAPTTQSVTSTSTVTATQDKSIPASQSADASSGGIFSSLWGLWRSPTSNTASNTGSTTSASNTSSNTTATEQQKPTEKKQQAEQVGSKANTPAETNTASDATHITHETSATPFGDDEYEDMLHVPDTAMLGINTEPTTFKLLAHQMVQIAAELKEKLGSKAITSAQDIRTFLNSDQSNKYAVIKRLLEKVLFPVPLSHEPKTQTAAQTQSSQTQSTHIQSRQESKRATEQKTATEQAMQTLPNNNMLKSSQVQSTQEAKKTAEDKANTELMKTLNKLIAFFTAPEKDAVLLAMERIAKKADATDEFTRATPSVLSPNKPQSKDFKPVKPARLPGQKTSDTPPQLSVTSELPNSTDSPFVVTQPADYLPSPFALPSSDPNAKPGNLFKNIPRQSLSRRHSNSSTASGVWIALPDKQDAGSSATAVHHTDKQNTGSTDPQAKSGSVSQVRQLSLSSRKSSISSTASGVLISQVVSHASKQDMGSTVVSHSDKQEIEPEVLVELPSYWMKKLLGEIANDTLPPLSGDNANDILQRMGISPESSAKNTPRVTPGATPGATPSASSENLTEARKAQSSSASSFRPS